MTNPHGSAWMSTPGIVSHLLTSGQSYSHRSIPDVEYVQAACGKWLNKGRLSPRPGVPCGRCSSLETKENKP